MLLICSIRLSLSVQLTLRLDNRMHALLPRPAGHHQLVSCILPLVAVLPLLRLARLPVQPSEIFGLVLLPWQQAADLQTGPLQSAHLLHHPPQFGSGHPQVTVRACYHGNL